jgi:hypothetical protein
VFLGDSQTRGLLDQTAVGVQQQPEWRVSGLRPLQFANEVIVEDRVDIFWRRLKQAVCRELAEREIHHMGAQGTLDFRRDRRFPARTARSPAIAARGGLDRVQRMPFDVSHRVLIWLSVVRSSLAGISRLKACTSARLTRASWSNGCSSVVVRGGRCLRS